MGGGAGGKAAAAHLTLEGHNVNMFELPRFRENIKSILEKGGIEFVPLGSREGRFAKINLVTTEIEKAIKGVDLILIIVPAFAHKIFAELTVPCAEDGQIVCFLGEGGGVLDFNKALKDKGVEKDIVLGEANSLPYVVRTTGPTRVEYFIKKGGVLAAALPAKNNKKLLKFLKEIYPFIEPATNIFETILVNYNAFGHMPIVISNLALIEGKTGDFPLATTPSVVRLQEKVDFESRQIRKALGLGLTTYGVYREKQGFSEEPLKSAFAKFTFHSGPSVLKQHRYIVEDVPYALVLMASIGDAVGVETPLIDALVNIASTINEIDYWKEGRTIEKYGLSKMGINELNRFLLNGIR